MALTGMWTIFFLGAIFVISTYVQLLTSNGGSFTAFVPVGVMYIVILASLALLIHMVSRGRNWARIVYIVVGCLAVIVLLLALTANFASPRVDWLSAAISLSLAIAYGFVLFQLLRPSSRQWFHAMRMRGAA